MDPRFTQILAIWGAVVSTIALFWQIFLWIRSNPRIAVKAEIREGFSSEADDCVSFELRNRGRQPTTVEEIMFVDHPNWLRRIFRFPSHLENIWVGQEKTMKLPVVLQPGEVWKGSCPLDARHERGIMADGRTRRERFMAGQLYYRIRCAHTDRLISGTVKPETSIERM